jgi:hypothetical protein
LLTYFDSCFAKFFLIFVDRGAAFCTLARQQRDNDGDRTQLTVIGWPFSTPLIARARSLCEIVTSKHKHLYLKLRVWTISTGGRTDASFSVCFSPVDRASRRALAIHSIMPPSERHNEEM